MADLKTFWESGVSEWYIQLKSSEGGLSDEQAQKILANPDRRKKKQSGFVKDLILLLNEFKSPLTLLLIAAVILSFFLGDTSDAIIILFILTSSSLLGFFQERNAGKVVEKLQSLVALKCTVKRDGKEQQIYSDDVVEGDVILLKAGDMIPADGLVISGNELHMNEASLTGESYPVYKQSGKLPAETALAKRSNCVWKGTNVISGTGSFLVIATGSATIFGSIQKSVATTVESTFERGIRDFGYFLMRITLVLSIFILIVNLLNHKGVVDSALFALALAVGMAPELLPAITTIAMSAGAKRMLEKKVIVRKLSSIQNLGEVNLLCTDKTGTITEGVIRITGVVNPAGEEDAFVKRLACINANFETGYANPIDDALKQIITADMKMPEKLGEIPYDFLRKRLSISVNDEGKKLLISKGAFEQILSVCTRIRTADSVVSELGPAKDAIVKRATTYGENGMRVIAVAYKEYSGDRITVADESEMVFAGLILLSDPVKEGITDAIGALKKLQVGLKIITGDNRNVARSIAQSIGIAEPRVMTGGELLDTSSEAMIRKVYETDIFAEVEPQQKESIIRALRKNFTVAYIGDGINDVSAINSADVGISVSNAVDVAKETADFVLMEKDLMVLADGIREGRKTFSNTLKYIFINTGSTFGNMFSVSIASLLLPFLPMLPKQILLTNFITDFPYLSVAGDRVDDEQISRPGKWNIKLIRKYMLIFGIHSSLFDVITFMVLLYYLRVSESAFQTGWFVESILTELFILFIIRTHQKFFKSRPGKNLFLLSVAGLILTLALPYLPYAPYFGLVPLPVKNLAAMIVIVVAYIITADMLKVWFFKKHNNS
ncbi:MAG: magnesium-translocating P-type ATPase [Bacteroidia bacterium]